MFDSLKSTIADLLGGRVHPADRRAVINDMKQALVAAKLGVEDLERGVDVTRRKLETERRELETVARRKGLAAGINDAETVTIAEKYERQHQERIAVLERKLEAQEAEAALARRDYDEMLTQLKAAAAGAGSVGAGGAPASTTREPSDAELGLPDDAPLNAELDALKRRAAREARDADADARLEELKRRMGQE
ncbi:MAG: hypothetical protein H3C62_01505 [Gemmatimonadaceae bacterium]|nr:hypothetical protein [Gemmatimonadaceae bacterium]